MKTLVALLAFSIPMSVAGAVTASRRGEVKIAAQVARRRTFRIAPKEWTRERSAATSR